MAQEAADLADQGRHDGPSGAQPDARERVLRRLGHGKLAQGEGMIATPTCPLDIWAATDNVSAGAHVAIFRPGNQPLAKRNAGVEIQLQAAEHPTSRVRGGVFQQKKGRKGKEG